MSGRVPAEEAVYGRCKQRAGHAAPMQLFAKERARKCDVYETIRPVTGTVRARLGVKAEEGEGGAGTGVKDRAWRARSGCYVWGRSLRSM